MLDLNPLPLADHPHVAALLPVLCRSLAHNVRLATHAEATLGETELQLRAFTDNDGTLYLRATARSEFSQAIMRTARAFGFRGVCPVPHGAHEIAVIFYAEVPT